MSLVGNLEELGLGEILQLVSLSRKTGVLTLRRQGSEGSIVLKQGLVVRASSTAYRLNLGEVLIRKGVIDPAVLEKALALQQQDGFSERLGTILTKRFAVPHETIEEVVREQIEQVVLSLFSWTDGTFEFDVQEHFDGIDGSMVDPLQFMLSQGLNPQFLALEGTRLLDENRHAAAMAGNRADHETHDDVDIAFDLVDAPQPVQPAGRRPLVIVDDDGAALQAMVDHLGKSGYDVHAMARSEDTLIEVDSLCRGGERPIVVIDLIMPRMDGTGVLGGLELLELLHNNFTDLPKLVMADHHHPDAEDKVAGMGYRVVAKPPHVGSVSSEQFQAFLAQLLEELRNVKEVA